MIVYQTKKMKKRVILILFDPNPEDCLLKGEDVKERRRVKSARHFNKSPKKIRELIEEHVNEIVDDSLKNSLVNEQALKPFLLLNDLYESKPHELHYIPSLSTNSLLYISHPEVLPLHGGRHFLIV